MPSQAAFSRRQQQENGKLMVSQQAEAGRTRQNAAERDRVLAERGRSGRSWQKWQKLAEVAVDA